MASGKRFGNMGYLNLEQISINYRRKNYTKVKLSGMIAEYVPNKKNRCVSKCFPCGIYVDQGGIR